MAEAAAAPRAERKGLGLPTWCAVVWLMLVSALAILAPVLPIADPLDNDASIARQGPSMAHLFGGDVNGKDVLSLTIYGGRVSLLVGFAAIALGLVVGGGLGIVSGYLRGRVDVVLSVVFDSLLGIPAVLFGLVLVSMFDPLAENQNRRMWAVALALGVVSIPILGRIARASTLAVADREYVLAARAQGAKPLRIMAREILPNVMPAMLAIGLLGVGVAIVAEGGLALLGAGVSLPKVSWGALLAKNRSNLATLPHTIFGPSIFLFLTVLALNQIGDAVRSRFDIRESVL